MNKFAIAVLVFVLTVPSLSQAVDDDLGSLRLIHPIHEVDSVMVAAGQWIRPGIFMTEPSSCTMGFVVTYQGETAMLTAGHCTDVVGQPVEVLYRSDSVRIGQVVARNFDPNQPGSDWAIVEIDSDLRSKVFPGVVGVGGPCPIDSWDYGWNQIEVTYLAMGVAQQGYQDILLGPSLPETGDPFAYVGPAAYFGDSGAPVFYSRVYHDRNDRNFAHPGPALGINTATIFVPVELGHHVYHFGTRVAKIPGIMVVNDPRCPNLIVPLTD